MREAAVEVLQVGRSLPLQDPCTPSRARSAKGYGAAAGSSAARGPGSHRHAPAPPAVRLSFGTDVSSCGRPWKWDTQRGEERGRVAATEEPRARGCGTGCPVSLSSSGVAEGKGASAVPLSPRTLGDRGAAPALPERTALQASPLAWSPVQSRSR